MSGWVVPGLQCPWKETILSKWLDPTGGDFGKHHLVSLSHLDQAPDVAHRQGEAKSVLAFQLTYSLRAKCQERYHENA